MKYKRFTEKRNGKNVIPLRNAVCGVVLPKWSIEEHSDIQSFLSGDAVDRLAELENKIENGTLIELPRIVKTKKLDAKYCVEFINGFYGGIVDGYTHNTREEAEKRLKEMQNG